jgi:hypothetical protein
MASSARADVPKARPARPLEQRGMCRREPQGLPQAYGAGVQLSASARCSRETYEGGDCMFRAPPTVRAAAAMFEAPLGRDLHLAPRSSWGRQSSPVRSATHTRSVSRSTLPGPPHTTSIPRKATSTRCSVPELSILLRSAMRLETALDCPCHQSAVVQASLALHLGSSASFVSPIFCDRTGLHSPHDLKSSALVGA